MKKNLFLTLFFLLPFPALSQNTHISPTLSHTAGQIFFDGKIHYASLNVLFIIQSAESSSGLKQIFYITDLDKDFQKYRGPFNNSTKEGRHYIATRFEDNVGNFSPMRHFEFILDTTPPQLYLDIDKSAPKIGDYVLLSRNFQFVLSAFDSLSGVKSIEYSLDGGPFLPYQNSFKLNASLKAGLHHFNYKATDNVGNVSKSHLFAFFLDNKPSENPKSPDTDIPKNENRTNPIQKPDPPKMEPLENKGEKTDSETNAQKDKIWGLLGNVYDEETKTPVKDLEVWVIKLPKTEKHQSPTTKTTNDKGDFRITLEKDSEYEILFRKKGFFNYTTRFSTKNKEPGWYNLKKIMKTEIKKAKIGSILEFEEIHFEPNSFNIDQKGKITLDKIADFLSVNTNIVVELRAHTDSRGKGALNQKLSEQRAQSAVHYLVKKGIAKERLFPRGFGETQIKNHCVDNVPCSKREHQINRRVELKLKRLLPSTQIPQETNKKYIIEEYKGN
ncbi:MAG: hypothetical protein CVV50_00915 [Spirochaetae bacterium HGW-Spirochaetae-6]|nr:MAG: hypothetical protein CVV50_00915 [Spirochaetae bacterium HGW-Spirochaetae-6]